MKFFDMFAGIGGFRLAFSREGFEPVGWCEIDKWCQKLYRAYHRPDGEYFREDILSIDADELQDFDIITAGTPCQPFSYAGKRKGLADKRGLPLWKKFFEVVESVRPTNIVIENVKGLLSSNRGWDFAWILHKMDKIGYDAEWDVLNSKDFGVPQNRERLFIIGHLRGESRPEVFPLSESDIVRYRPPEKASGKGARLRDPSRICRAIDANYRKGGGSRTHIAICKTILATYPRAKENRTHIGFYDIDGNIKIRKLTPLECFRLQGFPDDIVHKAREIGISDTQLYKMAGNAVTVSVAQSIARKLRVML
ncbi:MAG: DNA cytosine methyltransferase [Methermicoccaceae archaeon]